MRVNGLVKKGDDSGKRNIVKQKFYHIVAEALCWKSRIISGIGGPTTELISACSA